MDLKSNAIINIYSMALLFIIWYHSSLNEENESMQHKLYKKLLQITIVMLAVDILSRFDGRPDTAYFAINHFGNFLIYVLNPILPSIWLLYVHVNVFQEEEKTKRLIKPLIIINSFNIIMVFLTHFFGWYYYIDSNNVYHRGPLFLFAGVFTISVIIAAFAIAIVNRKRIKRRQFFSLVFFAVPPFICTLMQLAIYGPSLMLNSVALSLLIVFLNIQNHGMYIDYLTGVNNRKKLDGYLKKKISESTAEKTFSAIMMDLNNFKYINDNFGHDEGDKVLQDFAELLRNSVRPKDFIARYGGDEFCVVLDSSGETDLKEITERIYECIEAYNEAGKQEYTLGFSMGHATYEYHSHMKVEEFQKLLDVLLYENKQFMKGRLVGAI